MDRPEEIKSELGTRRSDSKKSHSVQLGTLGTKRKSNDSFFARSTHEIGSAAPPTDPGMAAFASLLAKEMLDSLPKGGGGGGSSDLGGHRHPRRLRELQEVWEAWLDREDIGEDLGESLAEHVLGMHEDDPLVEEIVSHYRETRRLRSPMHNIFHTWKEMSLSGAVMLVVAVAGAAVFSHFERASEESSANDTGKWRVEGALLFVLTVVSTIGYGPLAPSHPAAQFFLCFYAAIGIPLFDFFARRLGRIVNALVVAAVYMPVKACNASWLGLVHGNYGGLTRLGVVFVLLFNLVVIFVFAAFISTAEGWSYIEGAYFAVVTLTTIGFGDYTPKTSAGRVATLFFIVFFIGSFLALIEQVGDLYERLFAQCVQGCDRMCGCKKRCPKKKGSGSCCSGDDACCAD
mmetsp:Transcript_30460/g.58689  ORF Transcript_30460/g.58689 Transcript_30460/m.58689 type:complete len:403 (-) Transcript_30460:156-1364(-)|eukprot:CAMPEP_0167800194 /NCGR_PEP_ID=MMETSP0111_2-20121227/17567_1 /TAXON_ID=91324 /ORGANISM="Lotharella globosa, Strain CCCM811" /LENGTH=402 /DNA_ID=CAMNT_0007695369 /DNA_START=164 /DNA_END=1372 /DNA_ORIENTATION=-